MPLTQDSSALRALTKAVELYDDYQISIALQSVAEATGSLALALAFMEGVKTPEEIFTASEVEGDFQATKWGDDPVTVALRRAAIKADLEAAATCVPAKS